MTFVAGRGKSDTKIPASIPAQDYPCSDLLVPWPDGLSRGTVSPCCQGQSKLTGPGQELAQMHRWQHKCIKTPQMTAPPLELCTPCPPHQRG